MSATSARASADAAANPAAADVRREDASFDSWGERCACWQFWPAQERPASGYPTVLLAHGFGGIREAALDHFAARFARAGLAAVVFDYRHFGASGGQPRQLLDITRQLQDWAAALTYLRARPEFDSGRLALWGSSFSGGHVLATAARDHGLAAVIAQVPFTDGLINLPALGLGHALRLVRAGLIDQVGAWAGRPPYPVKVVGPPGSLAVMNTPDAEPGYRAIIPEDVHWVDEVAARIVLRVGSYRPGREAGAIVCPVLFCIASQDAVTPPATARRAAERAPLAEVREYPIGHFDIYRGEPFERAVADEVGFLRRHLLEEPPVSA